MATGRMIQRKIRPGASQADLDRYYRTSPLPSEPLVYFAQAGKDGPIKIGFASNLRQRLASIQVGNHEEVNVIGWIFNGDRRVERSLHVRFAALRIRGDWFRSSGELLSFIQEHRRP